MPALPELLHATQLFPYLLPRAIEYLDELVDVEPGAVDMASALLQRERGPAAIARLLALVVRHPELLLVRLPGEILAAALESALLPLRALAWRVRLLHGAEDANPPSVRLEIWRAAARGLSDDLPSLSTRL